MVILETRKVGHAVDERMSRSSPTASMPFHRSSKFAETVTSETGKVFSPFSI